MIPVHFAHLQREEVYCVPGVRITQPLVCRLGGFDRVLCSDDGHWRLVLTSHTRSPGPSDFKIIIYHAPPLPVSLNSLCPSLYIYPCRPRQHIPHTNHTFSISLPTTCLFRATSQYRSPSNIATLPPSVLASRYIPGS